MFRLLDPAVGNFRKSLFKWLPGAGSIGYLSGLQSIMFSGYYRFDQVTIDPLCRPLRASEPGDES
jgi:hypothetical protein